MYLSPQLADDLIMGNVKRPSGKMINDPSALIAAHNAQQARDTLAVDTAGKAINLNERRLDENQRQFGTRLGLARDIDRYNSRAGDTAALLAGAGLGISTLSNIAERKRQQERMAYTENLISKLNKIGDSNSLFFADMLKYMHP